MIDKQFKVMKLSELIPYENNPRINDETVKDVIASIEQCENIDPIEIDENNIILSGHTRLKALKKLKYKETEVIQITGLSEEQKRKYRILANKTGETAEWDLSKLEIELADLDFEGYDFDFDGIDFAAESTEPAEVVEDDYNEELTIEPKAKLGDIYQLGRHRLMCGDSTDNTVVDRLMNGEKADCVFTDPPYGMKYTSHRPKDEVRFEMLQNDDKILDFFPCIERYSSGFVFVCTTWKVLDEWLPLFKKYFDLSNMIIWNKGGGGIGDLKHTFSTDYEVILCASNGKEITGKRIGSVWSIPKDNANNYTHPTQKPVKLAEMAIRNTTNSGDVVADLFGGSGSTLIACEQLGRNCYMMEYEAHYVDVIIDRWEKFTGQKAIKLN